MNGSEENRASLLEMAKNSTLKILSRHVPPGRLSPCLLLFAGVFLSLCIDATADTLELKNGNCFEGIITKENGDSVELDMGTGTLLFSRKIISRIHRSSPEELDGLRKKMKLNKEDIGSRDKEYAEAREERLKKYEKWIDDGGIKNEPEDSPGGEIKLLKVENSKDLMVEVVINGRVKATLILDTGSYDIVLTRRVGEALGVDFSDAKDDVRSIRLAGRERLAKVVRLDSIRLQDVEEKGLIAEVLFEDADVLGLRDGLLGLAFLNRFECVIDLKKMKMRLEKKQK